MGGAATGIATHNSRALKLMRLTDKLDKLPTDKLAWSAVLHLRRQ